MQCSPCTASAYFAESVREAEPSAHLLVSQQAGNTFLGCTVVLAGRCTTELAGWPGRGLPFSEWKGRRKRIQICRINCFSANGIRVSVGVGGKIFLFGFCLLFQNTQLLKCIEMHWSKIKAMLHHPLHCMLQTAK